VTDPRSSAFDAPSVNRLVMRGSPTSDADRALLMRSSSPLRHSATDHRVPSHWRTGGPIELTGDRPPPEGGAPSPELRKLRTPEATYQAGARVRFATVAFEAMTAGGPGGFVVDDDGGYAVPGQRGPSGSMTLEVDTDTARDRLPGERRTDSVAVPSSYDFPNGL